MVFVNRLVFVPFVRFTPRNVFVHRFGMVANASVHPFRIVLLQILHQLWNAHWLLSVDGNCIQQHRQDKDIVFHCFNSF